MPHSIQPKARADILRHYEHFLEHAPIEIAESYLSHVEAAIRQIIELPGIGARYHCDDPRLAGLRSWQINRFEDIRIYYLADDDQIQIIRVLSSRQDLGALFNA